MSDALTKTLLRRERILARVARERGDVELAFVGLSGPVAMADKFVEVGRMLRAHPASVAVLVAAIVALRGRTLFGVVMRGIGLWRLLRQIRSALGRFGL